jgi:hypothetical protein
MTPIQFVQCIVLAGVLATTAGPSDFSGSMRATDSVSSLSNALARDCVESSNNQVSVETSRGDKSGEESMGLLVSTYECRTTTEATMPANVADLPWQSSDNQGSSGRDASNSTSQPIPINSQECLWRVVSPSPPAGDPRWEGNDPSTGVVLSNDCNGPTVTQFMPGPDPGTPAAPAPTDPAELAERAYREIVIPRPQINAGPDRTKLAVNLWTWLWIDQPGPQTVTVGAGGVSVTATAVLASVTWSLGEPAPTGGPYEAGPPVTVTCQGTGTPPPVNYDWKAEPPCGHKYTWRSTTERTRGTGTWPITATSNWDVTWQSNTGVSGSTTLTAASTDALDIGEYRIVLVQEPGG